MKLVAQTVGLIVVATHANATWVGPPPRDGWSATNQHGFCSLGRVFETSDAKLEFLFVSGLPNSDVQKQITFQVNATPAVLVRPVRLSPGSDATAPDIEVGSEADPGTTLVGAGAQKLFAYLKAGTGLDIEYSLTDGVERRVYLDTLKFPQSAAMFETCTSHVA